MNLQLASSEQLVDELFSRFPEAFFCGCKLSTYDEDTCQLYQRFQGHGVITQGMAVRLIRKIQDTEDYPAGTEEEL